MMDAKTAHAIGSAIIKSEGKVVDFIIHQSCDIVSARTTLVKEALKKDLTHILFIDSDMYFPADIINTLISREKDIIGVEYHKRKFPLETIGVPMIERATTIPYIAKYAGTGFLLIHLDVFRDEKLGAPTEHSPNGNPWFNFGRDSQGTHVMGEDVWFCNVARDAGYDIWIDPTIMVKHVGEYLY